ncbi:MAG: hypothetical protein CVU78_05255, partial [Elusimicrobia bacterium HGW-Elusimicrobia-2]
WNTNAASAPLVAITSEDTNASLPGSQTLTGGTGDFLFTFKTANTSWTITASNTDGALTSSETAKIQVNPASAVKLLCLVPNETYQPGTTSGKGGGVISQVAGEPFTVTVYGVDANWNINTSANQTVTIGTQDPYDIEPAVQPLIDGTTAFAVTLVRAWSSWVNASATGLTSYTTPSIVVSTNTAVKLIVLVPNVKHDPGEWSGAAASVSPYGRTGAPSVQTAGTGFSVTVMAVDNWWNRRYDSNNIVKITTEDPNDDLYYGFNPAAKALTDGIAVFISTMVTNDPSGIGNQWKITASTADGSALSSDMSAAITMASGATSRLQLLLPNESSAPGTDTGRSGTVSTQTAGVEFTVTVNAADQYWNFVSAPAPNPLVNIETSDPYDQNWGFDPTNQQLQSGTLPFKITMVTEGNWRIYGYPTNYGYTPATSSLLHVQYGAAAKYQVLLPTQTAVAGSVSGKSGVPKTQTAGIVFTATVNVTDAYWNIVPTVSPAANITTHDSFDTNPGNVQLINGSTTFPVIIKTASHGLGSFSSTQTVTASGAYQSNKSSVFGVNSYTPQKLLLLAPGERYVPGDVANLGRGGSPNSQPAGAVFTVTVISCDQYYNQASTNTNITIYTTDPYDDEPGDAQLAGGFKTFNITMKQKGYQRISSSDTATVGKLACYTSQDINIGYGPAVKLQVLLTGEESAPGTASGKTGGYSTPTAGVPYNITVNCVDQYWNVNPDANPWVGIETSDQYDPIISSAVLTSGYKIFSITPVTAGTQTVIASDVDDTGDYYTSNQSTVFNVFPAALDRIIAILPGETYNPGNVPSGGKTGAPSVQTAGSVFQATVYATDEYYNKVSTNCSIGIVTEDPYDAHPDTQTLVAGQLAFDIEMITHGSWDIYAKEITESLNTFDYTTPNVNVIAGSGSRLAVKLQDQTLVEGYGITGIPAVQEAYQTVQFTVYLTDVHYNIASDTRPWVTFATTDPNDNPINNGVPIRIDVNGQLVTSSRLKTSVVAGGSKIYAYSQGFSTGTTPAITVNNASHTNFALTGVPSNLDAGELFNVTVRAKDDYGNTCTGSYDKYGTWVGNKNYTGEIDFTSDTDSDPTDPASLPANYTFLTSDFGQKIFNNLSMFRAGTGRWLKAHDTFYTSKYGQVSDITVTAGALAAFIVSPTAAETTCPAGQSQKIIGTAADLYNNPKSTEGLYCEIKISTKVNSGSPALEDGDGFTVTHATTDANGVIGVSSEIWFYVSTVKNDIARVQIVYSPSIHGETGNIKTAGGSPKKYVIKSSPPPFSVKNADYSGWSKTDEPFVVQRYDQYNNISETGDGYCYPISNSADNPNDDIGGTSKPGRFFKIGVGDPGHQGQPEYFTEPFDDVDYSSWSILIPDGANSCEFYYYELKASWDSISIASWTITAAGGAGIDPDSVAIRVDPGEVSGIAFMTPARSLVAGTTSQIMTVHAQDVEFNEKVVPSDVLCDLMSDASPGNYSFIITPGGGQIVGNTEIVFSTGTYETSFWFTCKVTGNPGILVSASTDTIGKNWSDGSQTQTVTPAPISKIAFTTLNLELTAGVTSQIMTVELQDVFGNQSPIPVGTNGGNPVVFKLQSYPAGRYAFSLSSSVWLAISSATIAVGQAQLSFYYVNTKSNSDPGWEITVDEDAGYSYGWSKASRFVKLYGGQISQVVIITPGRNITAGVKNYLDYGATNYVFTAELRDRFDNTSKATEPTQLLLTSDSGAADFSPDSLQWTQNIVVITSGTPSANFYYYDEIVGAPTIAADERPARGWTMATQTVNVYPNDAVAFKVQHSGSATVYEPKDITVYAVDAYGAGGAGNVCTGHPPLASPYASSSERVYYVSVASFTSSGTTQLNPWSYDFADAVTDDPAHPGISYLQATDVNVTDPPDVPPIIISAYDTADPMIVGTSAEMIIRGALVTPYVDPETYRRIIEMEVYGSTRIYQGAVNRIIERIDLKTNSGTGIWTGLQIDNVGQTAESDIPAIRVWKDGNANARFDSPSKEDPDNLYGISEDIWLSSGAFNPVTRKVELTFTTPQTIGMSPQNYFITVDISEYAEPAKTFVVRMKDRNYFKWDIASEVQLASNNFEIRLPTATITTSPGQITVYGTNLVDEDTMQIEQGTNKLAMIQLDMVTNKYTVPWTKIRLGLKGSVDGGYYDAAKDEYIPSKDIDSVRIYKDRAPFGEFAEDGDQLISSGDETFGQLQPGVCIITLKNPDDVKNEDRAQIISESTSTYFVAFSFTNSATVGATAGVKLANSSGITAFMEGINRVFDYYDYNGNTRRDEGEPDIYPLESEAPPIIATVDMLVVNKAHPGITELTQGSKNNVFEQIILKTDARAVWWSGITVEMLGDIPNEDVDAVKIWKYNSGTIDQSGDPVVNISTMGPTGMKDVLVAKAEGDLVSNTYGAFTSTSVFILFDEASWQEITTVNENYLITYDLDPFAEVGSKLGLNLATKDNLQVEPVDEVKDENFPIKFPAIAIKEYSDNVTFEFSDATALIADKQINQGDVNLPILALNVKTNQSDAFWNSIIIDQAGSAGDEDIDNITIWLDKDNNGKFNETLDEMISSGTFHNGQAAFTFVGHADARRIGPVNTVSYRTEVQNKAYFINFSLSDTAAPAKTIALKIEGDPLLGYLGVSSPNKIATSFEAAGGYLLPSKEIKASPRTLYVEGESLAPETVYQGADDVVMMKLSMWVSGYEVPWTKLQAARSGTGLDEDIERVRLYRDVQVPGQPNYGEWGGGDNLVATGVFDGGICLLDFSTPTASIEIIPTTTIYYFILFDFANSATPGAFTGLRINSNSAFEVETPHNVYNFSPEITSVQAQQLATTDTLEVLTLDPMVAEVTQGDRNVSFARLTLRTDYHDAVVQAVRIYRTGSGIDGDIEAIKIYRDLYEVDGGGVEGVLDSWDIRYDTTTYIYPGLINYGNEVFIDGVADITLKIPQKVGTTADEMDKTYFVAFDIANLASVGKSVGFRILPPGASSFKVIEPDQVQDKNFTTMGAVIGEYPDSVTIAPWRDSSGAGVTPNEVVQGEKNILVEKFSLTTRTSELGDPESEAVWTGMRSALGGDVPDRYIEKVKVYRDLDGNGLYDSAKDQLIGHAGDPTTGAPAYVSGAVNILFVNERVTSPDISSAYTVGKDYMNWPVNKYAGYTIEITTGTGAGQKRTVVSNTSTIFTISPAWDTIPDQSSVFEIKTIQTIGTVAKNYFMVYDLSVNAPPLATLASKFTSPSYFFVSQPNVVLLKDNLPIESAEATIKPAVINMKLTDTAPPSCLQGELAVPMAAMEIYVSSLTVKSAEGKPELRKVKMYLRFSGGSDVPATYDANISAVLVYADSNGDGELTRVWNTGTLNYEISGDSLISSGNDAFSGNLCEINLTSPLVLKTVPSKIFIAFNVSPAANTNDSVGIDIGHFTNDWIGINPPERIIDDGSFTSAFSLIKSQYRPTTPVVTMGSVWTNRGTEVSAAWESYATLGVVETRYAIGRIAGGTENLSWQSVTIPVSEWTQGFASSVTARVEKPLSARNYFFSAQTVGRKLVGTTFTTEESETGCAQFFVDMTSPESPAQPTISAQETSSNYWIMWVPSYDIYEDAADAPHRVTMGMTAELASELAASGYTYQADENGVMTLYTSDGVAAGDPFSGYYELSSGAKERVLASGVKYYELQEQADTSAKWHTISSKIPLGTNGYEIGTSLTLYEDGIARKSAASFYRYRIRSLDKAGNYGEWSSVSAAHQAAPPMTGISQVSNYPNPVDATKYGDTTIAYTLSEPSTVDITLYDLLGKKVYSWHFSPDEEVFFEDDPRTGDSRSGGGKAGPNKIAWYLKNEVGRKVAKGGYICYIKVANSKGSFEKTYKIAVIR